MKSPVLTSAIKFIEENRLISPNNTIVIGLSGGPDSVFLFFILVTLKERYRLTLIAAHVNHESRENALLDEIFCKNLCQLYHVQFHSITLSQISLFKSYKGSFEARARAGRRAFFESLAEQHQADAIALGHHMQDQQETFFIRLLRGSSLTGLIGMRPRDGLYIRPLLHTHKQDILDYLHAHQISYCQDETNLSDIFLRNRIRRYVIPALKQADQRFDHTFEQTLMRLQQIEDFLTLVTRTAFDHMSIKENEITYVHIDQFLVQHPALQYRLLLHWLISARVPFVPTQSLLDEIIRFFRQIKSTSHALHQKWNVIKKNGMAYLSH